MLFYQRNIDQVEHGPEALMFAADHGSVIAEDDGLIENGEINASNIQTALIQIVGRFCENYASDLILTFSSLQPFIAGETTGKEDRWVIGVGVRASGVDHNDFIMCRLEQTKSSYSPYVHPENVYRKLLVLDIQDKIDEYGYMRRKIALKDITYSMYRLEVPVNQKGDAA